MDVVNHALWCIRKMHFNKVAARYVFFIFDLPILFMVDSVELEQ